MAIYRQVYMTFWTDPKVVNDFTPEDRYFYLYLITNNHTNLCGCYEVSLKQMVWETGYNEDTVARLIKRLTETHDVIRYDAVTNELLILNWHKYNWTRSKDLLNNVKKVAEDIKNPNFKSYILSKIDGGGTVVGGSIDGGGTSVTVTDTVSVSVPDADTVAAYIKSKRYSIDPERFISYYTTDGRRFPKNWKSVIDKWEATEYKKTTKPKSHEFTTTDPNTITKDTFGCSYIFEEEK